MWKSVEMAIWTIRNISYFTKKIVGSQFLKNAAPGGQFSVFLERLAYFIAFLDPHNFWDF